MKRALLTLLLDLSAADLRAVAAAWSVPLVKRSHADNVALVFAAMTDRWIFEDVLDALPEPSRALLATLITQYPDGLPEDAVIGLHGDDSAAFAEALASLRTALLAVRSAEGALYAPRELATLVARSVRERAGGDDAAPSLGRMLAALDLDTLADAARLWGVPEVVGSVRPGERERLIAELKRRTMSARALAGVEATLSEPARQVVAALREMADAVPLDEATARARIETPAARRALLRELTTSLLAWHEWHAGVRALVMPAVFRVPGAAALPPLVAVAPPQITAGWRHPYAFAWDVLTLLRLIEREATLGSTHGLTSLAENYALAGAFASQFWAGQGVGQEVGRDAPHPPAAALAFLATLIQARGLVTADARGQITLRDPVAWAKGEFAAQTRALFATWQALAAWPEGRGASVALWGVHWPTVRARLLDSLAHCGANQWHTLENLLARLVAVRPALLGEAFTAAGAVGQTQPDRDALTYRCAEVTLRTALTWFGVVIWGKAGNGQEIVQLTDTGRWLLDRGPEPRLHEAPGPPLTVESDGCVFVRQAEPPHLWPLLAFAEAETLGQTSVYRITADTLRRALRRGPTMTQMTRFLESRTGGALPEELRETLRQWAQSLRRVTLVPAALLTAQDPAMHNEIARVLSAAGAAVETLPDGRLLARHPDGAEALAAALETAGFALNDVVQ